MALINTAPVQTAPNDGDGKVPFAWGAWFQQVFNICFALTQSGVTANRPTSGLWVGRMYFDTTLNKPIWCKTPTSSPAVWVDATGAAV